MSTLVSHVVRSSELYKVAPPDGAVPNIVAHNFPIKHDASPVANPHLFRVSSISVGRNDGTIMDNTPSPISFTTPLHFPPPGSQQGYFSANMQELAV